MLDSNIVPNSNQLDWIKDKKQPKEMSLNIMAAEKEKQKIKLSDKIKVAPLPLSP